MVYAESITVKRSKKPFLYVLLFLLLAAFGGAAFHYAPLLYYQFTGDMMLRIEQRVAVYNEFLEKKNRSAADLYHYIADTRKMLDIVEKDHSASARLYYYRGLFDFYELLLRTELDGTSLIQLTGRQYLPPEKVIEGIPATSVQSVAKKVTVQMRKSLALDPSPKAPELHTALLVMILGDLLFSGRTDPILFTRMETIDPSVVDPVLLRYYLWMKLALLTFHGKRSDIEMVLNGGSEQEKEALSVLLEAGDRNLLLCYASYFSRDYLRALYFARLVKFDREVPPRKRAEAVRMEGEIFLIQRGPDIARFFWNQALEIADDPFIKGRLESLDSKNH